VLALGCASLAVNVLLLTQLRPLYARHRTLLVTARRLVRLELMRQGIVADHTNVSDPGVRLFLVLLSMVGFLVFGLQVPMPLQALLVLVSLLWVWPARLHFAVNTCITSDAALELIATPAVRYVAKVLADVNLLALRPGGRIFRSPPALDTPRGQLCSLYLYMFVLCGCTVPLCAYYLHERRAPSGGTWRWRAASPPPQFRAATPPSTSSPPPWRVSPRCSSRPWCGGSC